MNLTKCFWCGGGAESEQSQCKGMGGEQLETASLATNGAK